MAVDEDNPSAIQFLTNSNYPTVTKSNMTESPNKRITRGMAEKDRLEENPKQVSSVILPVVDDAFSCHGSKSSACMSNRSIEAGSSRSTL